MRQSLGRWRAPRRGAAPFSASARIFFAALASRSSTRPHAVHFWVVSHLPRAVSAAMRPISAASWAIGALEFWLGWSKSSPTRPSATARGWCSLGVRRDRAEIIIGAADPSFPLLNDGGDDSTGVVAAAVAEEVGVEAVVAAVAEAGVASSFHNSADR